MFYRLREELEKRGSFASRDYCLGDLDNPAAQHHLREDAFPDFQPEFWPVVLTRKSSLVDFIYDGGAIGGQGFLISEKVLSILEGMKLPPHRSYAVEVVHKEKPVDKRYFWLQILAIDNYCWIDFAKSAFTLQPHLNMDLDTWGEPVRIQSEQELKRTKEAKRADFFLHFRKLTLNRVYARSPFDLFYFDWLGGLASSSPLINDKLKDAFERENVVGHALTARPEIAIDAG